MFESNRRSFHGGVAALGQWPDPYERQDLTWPPRTPWPGPGAPLPPPPAPSPGTYSPFRPAPAPPPPACPPGLEAYDWFIPVWNPDKLKWEFEKRWGCRRPIRPKPAPALPFRPRQIPEGAYYPTPYQPPAAPPPPPVRYEWGEMPWWKRMFVPGAVRSGLDVLEDIEKRRAARPTGMAPARIPAAPFALMPAAARLPAAMPGGVYGTMST